MISLPKSSWTWSCFFWLALFIFLDLVTHFENRFCYPIRGSLRHSSWLRFDKVMGVEVDIRNSFFSTQHTRHKLTSLRATIISHQDGVPQHVVNAGADIERAAHGADGDIERAFHGVGFRCVIVIESYQLFPFRLSRCPRRANYFIFGCVHVVTIFHFCLDVAVHVVPIISFASLLLSQSANNFFWLHFFLDVVVRVVPIILFSSLLLSQSANYFISLSTSVSTWVSRRGCPRGANYFIFVSASVSECQLLYFLSTSVSTW